MGRIWDVKAKKTFRSVHCLHFVAFLHLSITLLSVLKTRRHTQVHSLTAINIKPFCINQGSKCGGFWALPQLWWQQKQEGGGRGWSVWSRKKNRILSAASCRLQVSSVYLSGQNQSYYSSIDSSVRRQCGLMARIPCELISCKTPAHKKISW